MDPMEYIENKISIPMRSLFIIRYLAVPSSKDVMWSVKKADIPIRIINKTDRRFILNISLRKYNQRDFGHRRLTLYKIYRKKTHILIKKNIFE